MARYQQTYEYHRAVIHPPQFEPQHYKYLDLRPASGALGAELFGLDLNTLSEPAFRELEAALVDHIVLFIRDQALSPQALRDFGARLGTLVRYPTSEPMSGYPEITEFRSTPDTVFNFGGPWHTDSMFLERPPKFTILHNTECPKVGGDTSFTNLYLAWDTLPEELRDKVDGKLAINSSALAYVGLPKGPDRDKVPVKYQPASSEAWQREVAHPVARTHPETRRKALYVSHSYTARFSDMTQAESLPIIKQLHDHAVQPNFTCRFRWQEGTLAIWDNRCCMHFPHNDYAGQVRAMRRVIVEGERPV